MSLKQSTLVKSAPWLLTAVLFIVWELICVGFAIPDYLLPAPTAIWASGLENAAPIMMHATQTLMTTLAGFALAVVVGMVLGLAVGASPVVYKATYPLLVGFNSIPKVAFVPVLVVWFGIGTIPAILTAFLISFFPVVVNVATGLATLEPELEDVLRSLGAHRWDIMVKVGLPRSLPYFFASLKVAITLAFVGSVISETVASNLGIGYLMMSASSSMNMPLVFAGLIVIGVMGVVMYELFALLERNLTGWAHRTPGAAT
ncbi:MAG TPA: ABC transporter permease [Zoogloea sp.]|uniref:ABC transporter permease n=1 Tax=Zoogloea sp. TaxID=49181 RepID=UPI002BCFFF2D|nr:ABC transporter permease [Zoogloea sp.]HMV17617.1 ABC transporter permease [Rhodocyclaceae bacterium]HMV61781.1 ABC transporter permease [Rhodocyclaceae bacterium]HMW51702.1 ABC transporter permease [Rhodocyclaceae bacterium]HMY48404.1 ABC transporter permease [Rhodocyclaceae bacterium]HMZ75591.1 ABC transporter permease [Rhodocyclaceae bacterium]